MIGSDINKKFEFFTDDQTEMSTDEELSLGNQKARDIYGENEWEFLRKTASGSFTGGYIDLTVTALDFDNFMCNYNDDPSSGDFADTKVVFVNGNPYPVIPMGARWNKSGIAYLDRVNKRIYIVGDTSGTYAFDYKCQPDDYLAGTAPVLLPEDYHVIIAYAMAIDDDVIQKTEKGRSNRDENKESYAGLMSRLKSYDAKSLFL